ncbi:MAG: hypothetical protein HY302_07605 [Opitutae bacterium]|nr:hypothetical protein [Opitutae bacterium]
MNPAAPSAAWLRRAFLFAVAAFGWALFSNNTADSDLWGHVLYGQRMLALGQLEWTDPFSWTAAGAPWINHEVLAELALGWVHLHAGGPGLWLLMLALSGATIWIALREAARDTPGGAVALAVGFALSARNLSMGFAARPQLWTALGLAVLLVALRRLHDGRRWPLVALPIMSVVWANTHGGVLAGVLLTVVAAGVLMLQRSPVAGRFALVAVAAVLALPLSPWGLDGVRWLLQSVAYSRPEITEWRPLPFDLLHLPFFVLAAVSIAAWMFTGRERRTWEGAVLAVLLVMALQHRRHAPLFLLGNLMFSTAHLRDLGLQTAAKLDALAKLFRQTAVRAFLAVLFVAAGAAFLVDSVRAPRLKPWTIEVERNIYPMEAVRFIKGHELRGNLLVLFEWGQLAIWQLPDNQVSFDGRLDTVYPHKVIDAHWKFYRDEAVDPEALDLGRADIALLPANLASVTRLLYRGWKLVYADPLAWVLVRDEAAQPGLRGLPLPIYRKRDAVSGRDAFPDAPSARSTAR